MQHTKESKRIKGVTRKKEKWQAKAKAKGRWFWLGYYKTQADAAKAVRKFVALLGTDEPAMISMRIQLERERKPVSNNFNRPGG